MALLAILGLLFLSIVAVLLASPAAKIELAKVLLCEGRAQLAARKAAALARRESQQFDGEITHAVDGHVREVERRFPPLCARSADGSPARVRPQPN